MQLNNWRTSSTGLITIAGAVVNLAFAIKHEVDDQTIWMVAITQVVTGLGLVFSRDSAASAVAHQESQQQISELQTKVSMVPQAIKTGETEMLARTPMTPVVATENKTP